MSDTQIIGTQVADNTITNAKIHTDAGIEYSKLDLEGQITDEDIAPDALIGIDKLSETVITADGSREFTGDQSMDGHKLTNLGTPTDFTDAVTKAYADNIAAGLTWKKSVKVATTTNGTLSTDFDDGSTLDGVTIFTGDRILIKDQTNAEENGIYIVDALGTPTRASDMDEWNEVVSAAVFIEQGTVNAEKGWVCVSDEGGTIDVTDIDFVQFTGTTAPDVVLGPASATDNAIARYDSTTGKLIKNSNVTIDNSGNASFPAAATVTIANGGKVVLQGGTSAPEIVMANEAGGNNLTITHIGSGGSVDENLLIGLGETSGSHTRTLIVDDNANVSGTNTGDQTITLTGDVTGSGTGSFAATIANDAVTFAKMQNVLANSVIARVGASTGDLSAVALGASQLLGRGSTGDVAAITLGTNLSMSGGVLNAAGGTAPVDSVNGQTGVVVLDTDDISEGTSQYFTDERAQDAVGGILSDSSEIDFTYNDGTPSITASIVSGSIDETKLDASVNASLDLADSALQPNTPITGATKTKITYDADGLVTAGADATTADIADSTNKRYVTDAQLTVIGNTSGINSGNQNLFDTIAVAGQDPVVADSPNDTLTLVAGANVTITTNQTTDEVTISATGGGSGGYETVENDGTPLTQRTNLNFVGNGISAVDDTTRTNISLSPALEGFVDNVVVNGIVVRTDSNLFDTTTIQGTSGMISVANGGGNSGGFPATIGINIGNSVHRKIAENTIDYTTIGNTLVYSVPSGKWLVITDITFALYDVSGFGGNIILSTGTNGTSYDNIMAQTECIGLNASRKSWKVDLSGASAVAGDGDNIYVRVNQASTGTGTLVVELSGYLSDNYI